MSTSATPRQSLISRAAAGTGASTGSGSGNGGAGAGKGTAKKSPWLFDSQGWKRFSVLASIGLSIASLVTSSIAALAHVSNNTIRALTVTGIIVNAVSVVLSAATSLDWRSEAQQDKQFIDKLLGLDLVEVQDNGKVTLLKRNMD